MTTNEKSGFPFFIPCLNDLIKPADLGKKVWAPRVP